MDTPKILIADDERSIAHGLSAVLEEEGYAVSGAGSGFSTIACSSA